MTRSTGPDDDLLRKVATLFEETLSQQPPANIVELWKEHLKIRRVLEEVGAIQAKLGDTDERLGKAKRDSSAIDAFLKWADGVGIARNNVTIGITQSNGFSLQATSSIPKAHIVARVPRHAMITLDHARKSAMLKKAFERDPIVSGMENVGLALFLSCQWLSAEKSKWNPYISVLPTTFPTPLFYSEDQLLNLKPSPIFEEALLFYRTISRQYSYFLLAVAKNKMFDNAQNRRNGMEPPIFYNSPFTVENFTSKLYFWAVGIVTTRVNMVPSESATGQDGKPAIIPALIPVLDMANHENLATDTPMEDLVCYSPDEECAVITSHKDVKSDEEVTIFYGTRSIGEHLLHNGFVPLHHGKFDVLKLKIGIPKTDKHLGTKLELVKKLVPSVHASGNIFHVDLFNYRTQPFSDDLLQFAAIFVATEPTEKSITTTELQKKGLEFLKARFSLLTRSYESSFDASKLQEISVEGDAARLKRAELEIFKLAFNHCELLEKSL
uniref:protein-histidine N-methyltransferase n=1 Tax=Caenorhabditis japonica TaxID=281687 RepID=A0A8R1DXL7_CAEJA